MVKVGIIGCGKIAQRRHVPEYASNVHAEIIGYFNAVHVRSENQRSYCKNINFGQERFFRKSD